MATIQGCKIARIKIDKERMLPKGIIRGTKFAFGVGDMKDEPCVYCGGPADTWEHVIPRSKGGKGFWNRVRACAGCNRSRGSKPFLVWMLKRKNDEKVSNVPGATSIGQVPLGQGAGAT